MSIPEDANASLSRLSDLIIDNISIPSDSLSFRFIIVIIYVFV